MSERIRSSEVPDISELSPSPEVFDVLRGRVGEPQTVTSFKTKEDKDAGGRLVEGVSLVQEGAGVWGLTDWRDSKEWSGIGGNHTWLMTRASVHFARELRLRSVVDIDIQAMLDGGLVSHAGRRQWDEAGWYPQDAPDATDRRAVTNEILGMQIIQGKVSEGAFRLVTALGHSAETFGIDPSVYDSWEYRIAMWADHRTGQEYDTLANRMGDFLYRNFVPSENQTEEIKAGAVEVIRQVIDLRKAQWRGEKARMGLEDAVLVAQEFGATMGSERLPLPQFMGLMLTDADIEAELEAYGVDTQNFNEEAIPMPKWEREIREQYVGFARESIFAAIQDRRDSGQYEEANNWNEPKRYDKDFPKGNWWADMALDMYYNSISK